MTAPNRIKAVALERRRHAEALRPELASRADRIWLSMEPGLKNFVPSEMGLLSDFIVAKLREYRALSELELLRVEQEKARQERRSK
jgi:hypothetical protein